MIQKTVSKNVDLEKVVTQQGETIKKLGRQIDKLQTQQKSTKKEKTPVNKD